jgi:hypothetical protein
MGGRLRNDGIVTGACAAAVLVAAGAWAAACQDTGASGSTGTAGAGTTGTTGTTSSGGPDAGTGGGSAASSFTPQGCGFSIAPRPEYTDWGPAKDTTAATPNIRRVRLGLGGNVKPGAAGHADPSTSSGFAWQTDDGTFASDVEWGTDPDPTTWPAGNRASGITWLTPPGTINANGAERMHEAYVCGLTPATTYYYRVGGGPSGGEVWSDVYSFTTTPKAGPATVKLVVTGDSRGEGGNAWQIVEQRLLALGPTMQLFSGDMINFSPDQGEWEEWLDKAWKDTNGSYSALGRLLTLAAHGNHDNHTALFYGNLTLPQDVANFPKYGELFYSVDVGPVHIVTVDDFWVATPSGDQAYQGVLGAWLEADLTAAEANRANVPWIVTMHHEPEYSSSSHGNDPDVLLVRNFFAPIWDKHHVDLALAGHDHDYERSYPLNAPADPSTDPPIVYQDPSMASQGTVYMVCAGSGADAYHSSTNIWTATSHDFTDGSALGFYSVITATATSMSVTATAFTASGMDMPIDTYTVAKK